MSPLYLARKPDGTGPISPYISLYLLISPYISLYLHGLLGRAGRAEGARTQAALPHRGTAPRRAALAGHHPAARLRVGLRGFSARLALRLALQLPLLQLALPQVALVLRGARAATALPAGAHLPREGPG